MATQIKLQKVNALLKRPRRNRRTESQRKLVRETQLNAEDFVLPLFVMEGSSEREAISAMPGCYRLSIDLVIKQAKEAYSLGIPAVALFPVIPENLKDSSATESTNPNGLLQRTVKELKKSLPDLCVITDVAMDPYSSDGHDGIVKNGKILNDETLDVLAKMAVSQAEAGADMVAPSDMMDGRVAAIRKALDENGFSEVGILSYTAKYASAFYGPFREALDSAPKHGDKKTYQMDPANQKEALRELELDIQEGADIVMVKPALPYLDVIMLLKQNSNVPVAAYNVSGEFSMLKAAHEKGWLEAEKVMMESLISIKRAGADIIFTYFAIDAAKLLRHE